MLAIRFARVGRKNRPQYQVVVQEKTVAPGGRHVEVLGGYDPHHKKAVLKAERIKHWMSVGAQVSESAYNLFVREGIVEGKKRAIKMERPKVAEVAAPAEEAKEEVKAEEQAAAAKAE